MQRTGMAKNRAIRWLAAVAVLAAMAFFNLPVRASRGAVQAPSEAAIIVDMHTPGAGWIDAANTSGPLDAMIRQMEPDAVRMRLYGDSAHAYRLRYRVRTGDTWSQWTTAGVSAGTGDPHRPIEEIELRIAPKH